MKLVPYFRVSTKQQGESGLGLEAQKSAVDAFARSSSAEIGKTFVEVESGKRADRPELLKAIAHAKRCKATLVVAKLDRLARNVAFTSALMESGCEFVACDNPHANRLTIHILAAVAEEEARAISCRTKAALAAYKARGGILGSARPECASNLSDAAQAKGQAASLATRIENADKAYADLYEMLLALRSSGKSLQDIADSLNADGLTTRRGCSWNKVQVRAVLLRAEKLGY